MGPEFVTGSTRMKAGTAQKLILNMISTATMIRLGRVEDNKMVDMLLTNHKLIDRGIRMIMEKTGCSRAVSYTHLPASVVVFFVAVPLCLGIALGSGAPLFSGIIAGIVGGIVVGMASGSPLGAVSYTHLDVYKRQP